VLLYGAVRLPAVRGAHTEGPRIALVQPDMLHYRDAERTRQLFENELTFTRERVPPGSVDLIAWPENAVDDVLSRDPLYLRELARLARELRASVVTGAFTWASPEAAARAPRSVRGEPVHTSAYVFTAEGDIAGRYDKIYLIPWAEKAPGGTLPLLGPGSVALGEALLGYRARDVPGERVELFPVTRGATAEARFATPICYEVSSPAFCRRAVRNGADFLLNISSEGLMGAPIYNHMWNLSLFRAVEVRLPIARAGNHGISGFIDATGAPYAVLQGETTGRPYREPGVLLATMRLYRDGGSLYARVGDLFSYLCLGISVVLTLAAGRPRRRA
jgi:apolipoprotein N-acyltransferase